MLEPKRGEVQAGHALTIKLDHAVGADHKNDEGRNGGDCHSGTVEASERVLDATQRRALHQVAKAHHTIAIGVSANSMILRVSVST